MPITEFLVVTTTTETEADAQKIAKDVVEKHLAACAQVFGPIQSYFWWEGQVQQEAEWRCDLKTRIEIFDDLVKAIEEIHPYDVPQIISKPIAAASKEYLDWLEKETNR
ncbi:MAG: divalent-cation tolerance protein CutA [Candidatus Sumerlaeia bacterium]